MNGRSSIWTNHVANSGMKPAELWLAFVGVGGTATRAELDAIVDGQREPTLREHNDLAQALNDHFTEAGQNHPVAYRN